jgi:hypothetical protein
MSHSATATDGLMAMLPYGRRYARALTGTQRDGDAIVAAALRAGLPPLPGRLGLFAAITALMHDAAPPPGHLSPVARQLLLLTALEGLSAEDAGLVVGLSPEDAQAEVMALRPLQLLDLPQTPGDRERFPNGKHGVGAVGPRLSGAGDQVGQKVAGVGHGGS